MPSHIPEIYYAKFKIVPDQECEGYWNIQEKIFWFIFETWRHDVGYPYFYPKRYESLASAKQAINEVVASRKALKNWRKEKPVKYP